MQFDELLYEAVIIQDLKSKISQLETENQRLKQTLSNEEISDYRKILEKYEYELISCKYDNQQYIFRILDLRDSRFACLGWIDSWKSKKQITKDFEQYKNNVKEKGLDVHIRSTDETKNIYLKSLNSGVNIEVDSKNVTLHIGFNTLKMTHLEFLQCSLIKIRKDEAE